MWQKHVILQSVGMSQKTQQVYFAGCRLQVAGWNLIITEKLLALKIINNIYIRQGFLVRLFHLVETRSICYKYLSINTLITWDQWNLFKAIWMATPQMFSSIPGLARVFPQQQKIAITTEANK